MKLRHNHSIKTALAILIMSPFMLPGLIMLAGVFFKNGHFTLSYVSEAFSDPNRIVTLLVNSGIVLSGTIAISIVIGSFLGFLAFRTNVPFRRMLVIALILASCIPLYAVMSSWMALFGKEFLMQKNLAAFWIMGIAIMPLIALMLGIYFASGDRVLEEQVLLDTDEWGVFRYVTLPQASWGIIIAILIVTILTVSETTVTDVLDIRTFGEETRTQFALSSKPWQAAATALPLITINFIIGFLLFLLVKSRGEATVEGIGRPALVFNPGKLRFPLAGVVLIFITAFFLSRSYRLLQRSEA